MQTPNYTFIGKINLTAMVETPTTASAPAGVSTDRNVSDNLNGAALTEGKYTLWNAMIADWAMVV